MSSSSSPPSINPNSNSDSDPNSDQASTSTSWVKPIFSSSSPYASLAIQPGQTKSSIKRQFKREQWQEGKQDRRKKERDRKKERKALLKNGGQKQQESDQQDGDGEAAQTQTQTQDGRAKSLNEAIDEAMRNRSQENRVVVEKDCRVVIDCGFDDLMTEQEITSMSSQLSYLYSVNRSSTNPFKNILITGSSLLRGGNYCKTVKKPENSDVEVEEISKPHESAIKEALESGSSSLERAEIESCGGWNSGKNPRPEAKDIKDVKEVGGEVGGSGGMEGEGDKNEWFPSVFEGRIGKRMEIQNRGHWRKWKRIQIIEKGGLEGLWNLKGEDERKEQEKEVQSQDQPQAGLEDHEMNGTEEEKVEEPQVEVEKKGKGKKSKKGKAEEEPSTMSEKKPPRPVEEVRKEDVIYLTADSENTLEELEDGKVYVLGGIVDRNRYKDLCSNKAKALGLETARLPIDAKFMMSQSELKSRKVLTVNQVLEILVGWNETKDWKLAICRGMPVRKLEQNEEQGKGKRKREEESEK